MIVCLYEKIKRWIFEVKFEDFIRRLKKRINFPEGIARKLKSICKQSGD